MRCCLNTALTPHNTALNFKSYPPQKKNPFHAVTLTANIIAERHVSVLKIREIERFISHYLMADKGITLAQFTVDGFHHNEEAIALILNDYHSTRIPSELYLLAPIQRISYQNVHIS